MSAVPANDALRQGREAYAHREWVDARSALLRADAAGGLDPADLELLATCAYMLGRDDEVVDRLTRAHHAHVQAGAPPAAARCAFWLGLLLMPHDAMLATGWLARAERLLDARAEECVEDGWLLLPVLLRHVASAEWAAAGAVASEAARIAVRFGDADLLALAVHEEGFALVREGHVPEGLARIDEAMVAVVGGELSPIVTGLLYCSVLSGCQELCELRRAYAWTDALEAWCDGQPSLVAFTGDCLLHRAEVLQQQGAWDAALTEAQRAATRLEERRSAQAAAAAAYRQGEIHRLRGDLAGAEAAYRAASRQGFEPQPGLALLRLAQGTADVAVTAVVRALAEQRDPARRGRLLPAVVEIALAAGDRAAAEQAASELDGLAAHDDAGMLAACAADARGALQLADGHAAAALVALRTAARLWTELHAPYEAARTRVRLAAACRALGDEEAAAMEDEAAAAVFAELGAQPELSRLALAGGAPRAARGGLSARELEVLRLVAAGETNRAIAGRLVLSERTVDRHVSNILAKLRVPSRAAATARAYERGLL
jgi:DNA-binding NarL/FixJ family response regulator